MSEFICPECGKRSEIRYSTVKVGKSLKTFMIVEHEKDCTLNKKSTEIVSLDKTTHCLNLLMEHVCSIVSETDDMEYIACMLANIDNELANKLLKYVSDIGWKTLEFKAELKELLENDR